MTENKEEIEEQEVSRAKSPTAARGLMEAIVSASDALGIDLHVANGADGLTLLALKGNAFYPVESAPTRTAKLTDWLDGAAWAATKGAE